jgi:hypothetical protein
MAKSERKSKWKRKMRAIKRERKAPIELARLQKILPKIDMDKIKEIAQVKEESMLPPAASQDPSVIDQCDDKMQTDVKKYNSKTKRDENGQYPVWMNQRAIKKIKKRLHVEKKSKNKKKNK